MKLTVLYAALENCARASVKIVDGFVVLVILTDDGDVSKYVKTDDAQDLIT